MNKIDELLNVENEIENLYLALAYLEISGNVDGVIYENNKKKIDKLLKKERNLFLNYSSIYINYKNPSLNAMPIHLGFDSKAFYLRINHIIDSMSGDTGIEYADALYYDINRVLLKFLENMIHNPYYEDIRNDLIYFKYDIIYLDMNVENDFILFNNTGSVVLDSRLLKEDLPSSKYINQAILVLGIEEAMKQIMSIDMQQVNSRVFVVIEVMQIMARLALCSEYELALVMDDVNYMMESEDTDLRVKEIFLEMTDIFRQIQNSFHFSR